MPRSTADLEPRRQAFESLADPQPSRYLVVMDDQALATARKIDEQLRMLRYERERVAPMPNMTLNVERIDERINRLEKERAQLIEGTGKDQAPR